jgi:MarR family 2-MHQ and catechol resistance regulon transcriptional repressor
VEQRDGSTPAARTLATCTLLYYLDIKMNSRPNLPPDPADETSTLKLWVVLNRAQRAIGQHIRRGMQEHELQPSEFAVLEILYSKGELTLGDVASRILLTTGSTTPVIDKLERRGLLRRVADPDDRRVVRAALTGEGRALMDRVFPEHVLLLRSAMAGLTAEEKAIASVLLKRLGRFASDG